MLIVAVTALHSFDTKVGGRVQEVFTILKVALIVVFIVAGLALGQRRLVALRDPARRARRTSCTTRSRISLMYVSFAYSGWNAAAYIAGEVEKPEKTLPRSLLLGTGVVMALYVLLNVVYFYAVPSDVLAGPPDKFAPVDRGRRTLRRVRCSAQSGGNLITSLIALALVSAVSAMIMAGPRVYAAMAADRALPHAARARTRKRGVPTVAVVGAGRARRSLFVLVGDLGAADAVRRLHARGVRGAHGRCAVHPARGAGCAARTARSATR